MKIDILQGDCREVLRTLPDNSIDSCVTDPPYALVSIVKRFGAPDAAPAKGNDAYTRASAGFMGKKWDTGETAFDPVFWFEVLRVLKPGAFICAFGATRGYHRMACAVEDAGFEIRDSLMWLYGTGFPKSHDVSKGIDWQLGAVREVVGHAKGAGSSNTESLGEFQSHYAVTIAATPAAIEWQGWGTALKPAFEPIVLARKPLSEKTVAANVLRWRTGALNIDACRVPGAKPDTTRGASSKASSMVGTLGAQGRIVDDGSGRWPANVITDGSAEVVDAFPSTASGFRPNQSDAKFDTANGVYKGNIGKTQGIKPYDDSGSAARFFYSAKASKTDRNGSKHPTVKPIALMQWLTRLVTPPGGAVLDPFAGSGTTGAACAAEGFNCVLIEREAEYVADIKRRLLPSTFPWAAAPKMPWETA